MNGYEPAAHHRLIIEKLEAVERQEVRKLMLFLPPGSAKSTYSSKLFPAWYISKRDGREVLQCSHNVTLAETFTSFGRDRLSEHNKQLGVFLHSEHRSAGDWQTTNRGRCLAAGVGAGIAGIRADLGLIDDPIGSQEDADSKLVREKQKDWYYNDFKPRLKPNASVVLIMTRRHEDDLAGHLLATEGDEWTVVSLPFLAEENDPLGRPVGQMLWPEWFNEEMLRDARKNPQTLSSLYQQRPTPEEGDFFKSEWFKPYTLDQLPAELRIYAASDHAVSLAQSADLTCCVVGGVDDDNNLWILPDLFWKREQSDKVVEKMLAMQQQHKPLIWWAEKGHISKSIGPFLQRAMLERGVYVRVDEVTPAKDKQTRAQSIQGRMAMGKVRFPTFAPWWPNARHEMLTFPHGKHDDFVDALAHLGGGLARMTGASRPAPEAERRLEGLGGLTMRWIKDSDRQTKRLRSVVYDN